MPQSHASNEPTPPAQARPEFGAMLRQARERRGITLREISSSTKISLMTLEALERGDIGRLPGGIFTRAFVRAVAQEVGLDPERTVREFVAQYPSQAADGEAEFPAQEGGAAEEEVREPAWYTGLLRPLGVIVPVLLVVAYFGFGGRWWRSAPPTPAPRADAAAPSSPTAGPAAAGSAPRPSASPGGPVGPETGAPPAEGSLAQATLPTPDLAEAGPPEEPADVRIVLRLAPTEECWVWWRADDADPEQQLMRAGEAREIRARDSILMTLGNAGAMVFSVNGQPGRRLGEAGAVVKDLRITPQNFRTFLSVPRRP